MKMKLLLGMLMALFLVSLSPAGAVGQALGASHVVAPVGLTGYPEGIAVQGNRFYVTGPAAFGLPLGSAYVQAYDLRTGAPAATYPITITNPLAGMSGASCAIFGPDGKLYVIEPFVGVIRMDLDAANTQSVYAAFPPAAGPSLLNDLVFDAEGNLYVTDSFQATIYRIPPGGGAPEVWFADPRLAGHGAVPFGVNGIRIDKNNKHFYLSVTAEANTMDGVIYRLPLSATPTAGDLAEVHRYRLVDGGFAGPDGIAFGKSGNLYVALAGSSQISVIRPDGTEERLSGPALGPMGTKVAWTNPANIAFDNHSGSLLVTNHASMVEYNPALFWVFSVFVDDKGQPLP